MINELFAKMLTAIEYIIRPRSPRAATVGAVNSTIELQSHSRVTRHAQLNNGDLPAIYGDGSYDVSAFGR